MEADAQGGNEQPDPAARLNSPGQKLKLRVR